MSVRPRLSICIGLTLVLIGGGVFSPCALAATQPVHHDLSGVLEPDTGRLRVEDVVTLPPSKTGRAEAIRFRLHAG